MNKTSKVTAVQANGTWQGNYGLMYKYEVTFENGDTGEYSSKTEHQTKFKIGVEAEYTITEGKYPKVKPVYVQGGSVGWQPNPGRDLKIVKQSCLKAAVELCVAGEVSLAKLLTTADKLVAWVQGEADQQEEYTEVPKAPKKAKKETTDLPF